jgi:hypothetical protein
MADDDVIERPRSADEGLPSRVREELKRQDRGREAPAPAGTVHAQARVVHFPTPAPAPSPSPAPPPEGAAVPPTPDQLSPLPLAGSPYDAAHSRIFAIPLPSLVVLPAGGLPKGFAYHYLEHHWMVDSEKPGGSPDLLLRFNGGDPYEILAEGRGLLVVCDLVGLHLVRWIREHPTGHDDGSLPVFIRRITLRRIERG